MPDAFTVLWTHDTCRELRKSGRIGERPTVAYSGVHTSLPSWGSARPGDEVYAVHVMKRVVYVVCRMRVLDKERGRCCGAEPEVPGHDEWWMLGAGGCGASAVHVESTPIRFDAPVPGHLLAELTWRNRRGVTRNLKHVEDGFLVHSLGLQGFYRVTPETAELLAGVAAGSPAVAV